MIMSFRELESANVHTESLFGICLFCFPSSLVTSTNRSHPQQSPLTRASDRQPSPANVHAKLFRFGHHGERVSFLSKLRSSAAAFEPMKGASPMNILGFARHQVFQDTILSGKLPSHDLVILTV